MSRAGAVSLTRLHESSPDLARQAAADFAGVEADQPPDSDLAGWVLQQPLSVNGHAMPGRVLEAGASENVEHVRVDCRDAWGPDAQAVIDRVGRARRSGVS